LSLLLLPMLYRVFAPPLRPPLAKAAAPRGASEPAPHALRPQPEGGV